MALQRRRQTDTRSRLHQSTHLLELQSEFLNDSVRLVAEGQIESTLRRTTS